MAKVSVRKKFPNVNFGKKKFLSEEKNAEKTHGIIY